MSTPPPPASQAREPWTNKPGRAVGTITVDAYISERFNSIRAWYDKSAQSAKRWYLSMRVITVVGGVIVPVLLNLVPGEAGKWLATVISSVVAVLIALESVLHYREQWKNYRSTEQQLEAEYYQFVAGHGRYQGKSEQEALRIFVDRVENAIAQEAASTLNVMTTAVDPGAKPGSSTGVTSQPPNLASESDSVPTKP